MSREKDAKTSIINYVGNFVDRRDNELRSKAGATTTSTRKVDRNAIVIKSDEDYYLREKFDEDSSYIPDLEPEEIDFEEDPVVETRESSGQVYKQQVYLRQYQPPTPEPIDIQVHEVVIKPVVQHPPVHVYVGPGQGREQQRTPSPILIRSAPPQPPPPSETIVYNKYIPIEYKQPPQQIVIHRHPELPPKPRPIVVEQWLPHKAPPKRITYHKLDSSELIQNDYADQRNRFIEYKKPNATIEFEVVRLPVIKLKPEAYNKHAKEYTQLEKVRTVNQDSTALQWRI